MTGGNKIYFVYGCADVCRQKGRMVADEARFISGSCDIVRFFGGNVERGGRLSSRVPRLEFKPKLVYQDYIWFAWRNVCCSP